MCRSCVALRDRGLHSGTVGSSCDGCEVLAVLDEDVTQTFTKGPPEQDVCPSSPVTEMPAAGLAPAGIGQTEYVDS